MKLTSASNRFLTHIRRIKKLDLDSQALQNSSIPITRVQKLINSTTEALFLSLFTEYEFFIENVIVLSVLEKKLVSGRKPKSYLSANSHAHAHSLIVAGAEFGSWTNPSKVIEISERVLKDGFPVKDLVSDSRDTLLQQYRIRNRIAHKSQKAELQFRKIVRQRLTTIPIELNSVGGFLNCIPRRDNRRIFQIYLSDLEKLPTTLNNL